MSPTPTPDPTGARTITITSAGANPRQLTVAPGTRVLFVNSDTRSHSMNSDPHPDHTDCTEINQVGFINPGQTKETGNLNTVRTCGFHDHDNPQNASLQGRITIQ
jgi:plastocyanin